jgi:hypothetical protein
MPGLPVAMDSLTWFSRIDDVDVEPARRSQATICFNDPVKDGQAAGSQSDNGNYASVHSKRPCRLGLQLIGTETSLSASRLKMARRDVH